jgi:hypothetical protein
MDLDLTSCDFCEGGCDHPNCYRCHSSFRPENLRTLAQNLAAAAALCRAWQLGRGLSANSTQLWVRVPKWSPGCGLEAP